MLDSSIKVITAGRAGLRSLGTIVRSRKRTERNKRLKKSRHTLTPTCSPSQNIKKDCISWRSMLEPEIHSFRNNLVKITKP